MNRPIRGRQLPLVLCFVMLSGFCALPLSLKAQNFKSMTAEQRAASRKVVVDQSTALFAAGDYVNGEAVLLSNNQEKPKSLEWYLESANKLTQMALRLRSNYEHRGAITVANRALAILQEVNGLPASGKVPKRLAEWSELNGFIYENLLNDLESAQKSYQQALKSNSDSRKAKDALTRLAEAEAKRTRISTKGDRK